MIDKQHSYPDTHRGTSGHKWDIYIDGASRNNPGEAGIGVVIYAEGTLVKKIKEYIGIATNNVAEYSALIYGLQEALIQNVRVVCVHTDSQLLHRQIIGEYKVKDNNLKLLYSFAKHLLKGFKEANIKNIPREQNKEADKLAAEAIDARPVLLQKETKIKADQNGQFLDLVWE